MCLIAGSWPLGVVETALHATIDHLKCEERLSVHQDQLLDLACKLAFLP